MSALTDFCDKQTLVIAKLKEENTELQNALDCCMEHAIADDKEIEHLHKENMQLVDALTQIVDKHVYSYLPRKEGVMIKFSFDDIDRYRALVKHTKEGELDD